MKSPNTALGGLPIEHMLTTEGLANVAVYLDSRRASV